MNDNQRLKLQQMINENNVEDQTELIRQLKHSEILKNNINSLISLKNKYGNDITNQNFILDSMMECNFLYTYYTDIYNKIKKDEIDMQLLFKFINILKSIEDGEKDQHEASYEVGVILKEIYIDSALKKAEKLDALNETKDEYKGPQTNISWKQYKILNSKKINVTMK